MLDEIYDQIGDREIEVLALVDNKKRTIGGKRNSLLGISRGEFVSFVDDDDLISKNYVSKIYDVILSNPEVDLVTFNMIRRTIGGDLLLCKHDHKIKPPGEIIEGVWHGIPSHMMIWKNSIASSELFPNKNFGEDFEWMSSVSCKVKNYINIDEVLYSYEFGRTSIPDIVYEELGDPFAS